MYRYLFLWASLFSVIGFSSTANFIEGSFLGEGWYMTTSGQVGTYSSYVDVFEDQWEAAYVRNGQLTHYSAVFGLPQGDGFFSVLITQYKQDQSSDHFGSGYCIENTCHMDADLDVGSLEETITFVDENKVTRKGSLTYTDETGVVQTVAWKETLIRFDDYSEEDGDDDGEEDEKRPMPVM